MSSTSYKANELAAELNAILKVRFSTLTNVTGFDSNGNPTIAIGAGSAGGRNAFIRVQPISWSLAQDIFGNSANQYGPHVVQLCTEANPAGGAGADVLSASDIAQLLIPCSKQGSQFQWYNTANGTAPTVSGITAANLKVTVENDLYWNVLSSS